MAVKIDNLLSRKVFFGSGEFCKAGESSGRKLQVQSFTKSGCRKNGSHRTHFTATLRLCTLGEPVGIRMGLDRYPFLHPVEGYFHQETSKPTLARLSPRYRYKYLYIGKFK